MVISAGSTREARPPPSSCIVKPLPLLIQLPCNLRKRSSKVPAFSRVLLLLSPPRLRSARHQISRGSGVRGRRSFSLCFLGLLLPAAGDRRFWRGPFGRQVGRGGFFLAAGGMDSHAAGSSSGGSGDGAAQPRRNSRKPKCEIFFLNMILLMLSLFLLF